MDMNIFEAGYRKNFIRGPLAVRRHWSMAQNDALILMF